MSQFHESLGSCQTDAPETVMINETLHRNPETCREDSEREICIVLLTGHQRQALDSQGYCVLEEYMSAPFHHAMLTRLTQLLSEEGDAAGSEFRREPGAARLANLVDKGEVFRQAIMMPEILEGVQHVLGSRFKLASLNFRAAQPGAGGQPLHVDMGRLPDSQGYSVCNCVWMLDSFTAENGALRAVPGSHLWGRLPQEVLTDPAASHPDEVLVTGQAGTVVIMNAHTWHGGTTNHTGHPRRALHSFYVRYDLPQQQYQKQLLRPETQAMLTPPLRALLALDDPSNDEISTAGSGQSGFLR